MMVGLPGQYCCEQMNDMIPCCSVSTFIIATHECEVLMMMGLPGQCCVSLCCPFVLDIENEAINHDDANKPLLLSFSLRLW